MSSSTVLQIQECGTWSWSSGGWEPATSQMLGTLLLVALIGVVIHQVGPGIPANCICFVGCVWSMLLTCEVTLCIQEIRWKGWKLVASFDPHRPPRNQTIQTPGVLGSSTLLSTSCEEHVVAPVWKNDISAWPRRLCINGRSGGTTKGGLVEVDLHDYHRL